MYLFTRGVTISILNRNRSKLIQWYRNRNKKWYRRYCHAPCRVRDGKFGSFYWLYCSISFIKIN